MNYKICYLLVCMGLIEDNVAFILNNKFWFLFLLEDIIIYGVKSLTKSYQMILQLKTIGQASFRKFKQLKTIQAHLHTR